MYSQDNILLTSGPIIISKLLEHPNISFAWALRISAFISLPLILVANCFIKKRLPPREPGPFVDLSFFHDPRYCLFVAAQFLVLWGNWTPYFFVQSIAAQVGVPSNIAFYLVAIINGLSLPGRIIPGIIADKVGPWNVFVPSAISAGILTFACIGIHSAAGLYTYCVLYGLLSGSSKPASESKMTDCRGGHFLAGTMLCSDLSRHEENWDDVWDGNGSVVFCVIAHRHKCSL
jgi:predicted MFS family arabinose efflux permease